MNAFRNPMPMRRRTLLVGSAALAAIAPLPAFARKPASLNYVLVHGAWHGGWCWRDVVPHLQTKGRVFTPTLTGLGERARLRTPVPSLATHIEDIVQLIECEELQNVVLVGHSYGGMVITGVADRLKHRLRHVVYLDAVLPHDGQSLLANTPGSSAEIARQAEQFRSMANGGDWLPPPPVSEFGLAGSQPHLIAWVERRLTPHPLRTLLDPIELKNGGSDGLHRTYVVCTNPPSRRGITQMQVTAIKAGKEGTGWRTHELATGHDAMVTMPAAVAGLIAAT
ncbi:MAG: alpha/beta fold hydrolase [Steroidobacteraceae bacterium]